MPALVAGIHVFAAIQKRKSWMAGTSPAMTESGEDCPFVALARHLVIG
jgi:hypothetical protein